MSRIVLGAATAAMFMLGTAAITTAQTEGVGSEALGSETMPEQSDSQPTSRSDQMRQWRDDRMKGQRDGYSDRRQRYGHHHGWKMKDYRGSRMGQWGGMHSGGPGGGWGMMSPHMLMMIMVMMDTDSSGTISLEEMQAVHERMFNMIDQDGDGELSIEEMQEFMQGGPMMQAQQGGEASEAYGSPDQSEDSAE